MMEFSGALKLTGVDDFITPAQACTKPVDMPKPSSKRGFIAIEKDGKYVEVMETGEKKVLESAKITLNDCLACSGCVTTAETILIEAQSTEEFFTHMGKNQSTVVVSVSPQVRASLAARYGLSNIQAYKKLITMLKSFGVHFVFDIAFARDFSLLEIREEFIHRYKNNGALPLIVSSCPGWICYAEKGHGEYILPYISTVKSPQQVMGTVVKKYFASKLNLTPDKIYHVSLMPCADKKLEASREDFFDKNHNIREVDCVLTSMEIAKIIAEKGIDFANLEESPFDKLFTNVHNDQFFGSSGGSGGFLETTFKYGAETLFNKKIETVEYKVGRNVDFKEATLEIDGEKKLTFAIAYGFKNIQNIVQKIKKNNCPYQFVEIMACPSGCINGGGQIRAVLPETNKELLKRVDEIYHSHTNFTSPAENETVRELYGDWIKGQPYSPLARELLHTQYHNRGKTSSNNRSALTW